MPTTALTQYAQRLVAANPDPPRQAALPVLLSYCYRNRSAMLLAGFGLLLGAGGFAVGLVGDGPLLLKALFFLAAIAATALFVGAPAVLAIRYHRALRIGVRTVARVMESEWAAPGFRPPTIDAGTHGMTIGIRRVLHPSGEFDEPFQSDAPWASELRPGSTLLVLVDPKSPRTLMDLGPNH